MIEARAALAGRVSGRISAFAGAKRIAKRVEKSGHFADAPGMMAEAGGLINFRELRDGASQFRRRNGRGEFERSLRRGFLPAAAFEQAQHFVIFKRSEGRGEIAAAAGAKTPSPHKIAD